jgi:N-acetylmuramoyl-L-alanine amidase
VNGLRSTALAAGVAVLALGCGSAGGVLTGPTTRSSQAIARAAVERPQIRPLFIPYGRKRKREMRAYAQRHYGIARHTLREPKVIVEHYSVSPTVSSVYNAFAPDVPDSELHELPGVCAHFVVASDGAVYQLVSTRLMCRHTVGLNYTALGIEHVGFSERQILSNRRQLRASLALTRWLRCRFGISIRNVIGHNESLSSPYHKELVPALRRQTHADWTKPAMDVYRSKLRRRPCA